MNEQAQEYQQALIDPHSIYARPTQVLDDARLSKEQKLNILRRWEIDAREMQVAEDEGMIGGEDDMFAEIVDAIRSLSPNAADAHVNAPTKQGGSH